MAWSGRTQGHVGVWYCGQDMPHLFHHHHPYYTSWQRWDIPHILSLLTISAIQYFLCEILFCRKAVVLSQRMAAKMYCRYNVYLLLIDTLLSVQVNKEFVRLYLITYVHLLKWSVRMFDYNKAIPGLATFPHMSYWWYRMMPHIPIYRVEEIVQHVLIYQG